MASTCGSDSPPVSSACKAQRWYESQSRRLNNEGEKFFPRFAWTDRRYAPLCTAFRSASPTDTKLLPMALHSIGTLPFNIPRSAPAACRPRLPLTQQSRRMFNNFPPGCPPCKKSYVRPCRLLGGWSCPVPNVSKSVTAIKTSREAEIETDFPVDTLNDPMYQEFYWTSDVVTESYSSDLASRAEQM